MLFPNGPSLTPVPCSSHPQGHFSTMAAPWPTGYLLGCVRSAGHADWGVLYAWCGGEEGDKKRRMGRGLGAAAGERPVVRCTQVKVPTTFTRRHSFPS